MIKENKILLIGGSGTLGSTFINSKIFKKLDAPQKKELNLLNKKNIRKFIKKKYNVIINCAAIARMKECEKNPNKAIKVNVFGTLNLVEAIKKHHKNYKEKIKLIHISTDGVYSSTKGNYQENSPLKPYNNYGFTKMLAESVVTKILDNYIIVRTRFFDKKNIKFKTAATDIFTSMMEVEDLVKAIKCVLLKNYKGVINIGQKRKSDFENYKKFKPNIKPCKRKDIVKKLGFEIARDASMNLKIFNRLKKNKLCKKFH